MRTLLITLFVLSLLVTVSTVFAGHPCKAIGKPKVKSYWKTHKYKKAKPQEPIVQYPSHLAKRVIISSKY